MTKSYRFEKMHHLLLFAEQETLRARREQEPIKWLSADDPMSRTIGFCSTTGVSLEISISRLRGLPEECPGLADQIGTPTGRKALARLMDEATISTRYPPPVKPFDPPELVEYERFHKDCIEVTTVPEIVYGLAPLQPKGYQFLYSGPGLRDPVFYFIGFRERGDGGEDQVIYVISPKDALFDTMGVFVRGGEETKELLRKLNRGDSAEKILEELQ